MSNTEDISMSQESVEQPEEKDEAKQSESPKEIESEKPTTDSNTECEKTAGIVELEDDESKKPPSDASGSEVDDEDVDDDEDDDVQVTIDDAAIINANNMNLRAKQRQSNQKTKVGINVDGPGDFNGQPILEINLNNLEDKPWRKPGADISDYFNYGFNEETWKLYCEKQKKMRSISSNDIPVSMMVDDMNTGGSMDMGVAQTIPIAIVNSNDNSKYKNKPYMNPVQNFQPNYPRRTGPYFKPPNMQEIQTIVPQPPMHVEYEWNPQQRDRDLEREARELLERERILDSMRERHHGESRHDVRSDSRDKDRDRRTTKDRREKDRDRDRERERRPKERDRRDKDHDRRDKDEHRRDKDHDRREKVHERRGKDREHESHRSGSRHKSGSRRTK